MWVTFSLVDPYSSTVVGNGGFTFDSDFFMPDPLASSGYSGLVPALDLGNAGLDFTAGPLAGTHFDLDDDVHLWWWDDLHAPPEGLNLPMWSWGWWTTVDGRRLEGVDGQSQLDLDGNWYTVSWWGGVAPDDPLALPEPPAWPLLALGVAGALLWTWRKSVADSG